MHVRKRARVGRETGLSIGLEHIDGDVLHATRARWVLEARDVPIDYCSAHPVAEVDPDNLLARVCALSDRSIINVACRSVGFEDSTMV